MNEQEAKNRWCPQSIYVFGNGKVSGNRDDGYVLSQGSCNCIASDCMMWVKDKPNTISSAIDGEIWVERGNFGHCGLVK